MIVFEWSSFASSNPSELRQLLTLLILWSTYGFIYGQLYAVNYSIQDGLPNDFVTTVNADERGFIWVGTASGLVMFDGANFLNKGWEGIGDLPKDVFVREIQFDTHNNIWISTERNGIFHQDIASKKWTNFSNNKAGNQHITSDEIYDIELYNGKLLFGCAGCGLSFIDTQTLIPGKLNYLDKSAIKIYGVLSSNNALVIGTKNSLFYLKDPLSDSTLDTLLFQFPELDILDLYIGADNQLIISDYDSGLYEYKKSTKGLKAIHPSTFGDNWKYKYISKSKNSEWLLLPNLGIACRKNRAKWNLHTAQPFDVHSLPKAIYTDIFEDKKGTIWVSTSKGLSCIHPDYQGFTSIPHNNDFKDYLLDAKFDQQTSQYILSYASPEDRIKFFDRDFKLIKSINHLPGDQRIHSIFKLMEYDKGYLALGDAIYHIDPINRSISKANLPNFPNHLSPRAAFIDKDNLWMYMSGNKIIQYSLSSRQVKQTIDLPLFDEKTYPFYLINDLTDFGDYIAIAAQSLFVLISKSTGNIHYYTLDSNPNELTEVNTHPDRTNTIHQSVYLGDGEFYLVSKSEGVIKAHLDPETMKVSIMNSLASDQLYSPVEIVVDEFKRLWIATDNGMALVSEDLKLIKKINSAHGLKNNKLVQGLSLVNGRIVLNGEAGIILGDTTLLAKTNRPVDVDILKAELSEIDLLNATEHSFDYTQNNLTIEVAMPVYANREAYTYAYRLVNHIDDWSYQDPKLNSIHYEKLLPGKYVFEIKSVTNDLDGSVRSMELSIAPPFWKRGWFILLCGLTFISLFYLFYKIRLKSKLDHERLNTQLAELKNEAIRAQLNPHFIFNALNSIRSMILLDKKEESIEYLGHFSSMVRDILTLSKAQYIPLSREIELNKKYIQIEQLRFSQQFTSDIIISPEVDPMKTMVPPLLLQPFIENAIWHGLLHKEGMAILKVDITEVDHMLIIKIEDNGIGRKASEKLKSGLQTKTRKGYGEVLSTQRINTLGAKANIRIEDKTKDGKPDGTLVTIKIPIVYA